MKNILPLSILFLLCISCSSQSNQSRGTHQTPVLRILWADWAPAKALEELSKDFTRETGIAVEVIKYPWENLSTTFFEKMKNKETSIDLVGGDSQWIGQGAVDGFYVNITKWVEDHHMVEQMLPSIIEGFSEYPRGSKKYWSVPLLADAMGFAYRKDLFNNPQEQQNFEERYGYPLDIPQTWTQLNDIAEFFYRPEKKFYGVLVWSERRYDGITMGVQSLLWAYGAELGNPSTFKVRGILNSPEGMAGLKEYKKLYSFGPPEWKDAYLDSIKAFMQGNVAMVMTYFSFAPHLMDPEQNPYMNETSFFANPAGPAGRFTSLGGQGLSVISYSKNKEAAFKFLEWFLREDVQYKWTQLGGTSCNANVIYSDKFLKAQPFNEQLKESMIMMKDFWSVPEYSQLLEVSQHYWYDFITDNRISAEEAMNAVATEWEEIFELGGYYKE